MPGSENALSLQRVQQWLSGYPYEVLPIAFFDEVTRKAGSSPNVEDTVGQSESDGVAKSRSQSLKRFMGIPRILTTSP